jgi:hypothetical protein
LPIEVHPRRWHPGNSSSDSSSSSSESEKIGGLNLRKNDKKITDVPITSIYDDEIELNESDDETV